MSWPQATDYNAAVQNPRVCFSDPDLRQGQAAGDLFGLPRPHAGNFADVYQIVGADGQSWAVKCFTRPVAGLHQRYQAISDHLRQASRPFMVDFCYLEEGICIRGQWSPVLKMRWVEGFNLNDFVRDQLDKPVLLDRLAQLWLRLAQELRDAGMAHGDLQHGNVLLVPGRKQDSLALRLIDYDGMWVPALSGTPSGEVGHPNYQHPQRLRDGAYDPEVDRFSHLLICTALRSLRLGGTELWDRYDSGENLLFREEDFRTPAHSSLLHELWEQKDRDVHALAGHLLLASQGPLLVVPSLDELIDENVVRPLSGSEEAQVRFLLDLPSAAPAPPKSSAGMPPPLPIAIAGTAGQECPAHNPGGTGIPARAGTVPPPLPAGIVPAPVAVLVEVPVGTEETAPQAVPLTLRAAPVLAQAQRERDTLPEVALPPARPADLAWLLDPLVGLLSRPLWLGVLGTIALASFLLINVLIWLRARPAQTVPPAPPPPHLLPIADLELKGGHKNELFITVEREGSTEPLTVRVDDLPAGVKADPPVTLTGDQAEAPLTVRAALDVGPPPQPIRISLWQGDRKIDEQTPTLTVQKVPSPSLLEANSVNLKRGGTFRLTARVDRKGCQEPLTLEIEDLPRGIRQRPLPALPPSTQPQLELTAANDAAKPFVPVVNLCLRVGSTIADRKPIIFTLEQTPE